MTQHTTGPWAYTYASYTGQDGEEIPAFEVHGAEKVCDTVESQSRNEQEANARLIAAAPELLEALEALAEEARVNMAGGAGHLLDEAFAVIAKAKGE